MSNAHIYNTSPIKNWNTVSIHNHTVRAKRRPKEHTWVLKAAGNQFQSWILNANSPECAFSPARQGAPCCCYYCRCCPCDSYCRCCQYKRENMLNIKMYEYIITLQRLKYFLWNSHIRIVSKFLGSENTAICIAIKMFKCYAIFNCLLSPPTVNILPWLSTEYETREPNTSLVRYWLIKNITINN